MTSLALFGTALGAVSALMVGLWLVSLWLRDVSIVDVFWGPAFFLVALCGAVFGAGLAERRYLVLALVSVWAARLAVHLALRSRGRGEDRRYAAMRQASPKWFPWTSLFTVFLLQALLASIIALPLQAAATGAGALGLLDAAGAVLAATGILVEGSADRQLARFGRDPAHQGKVLDRGLWRYSRHPNYFGDAVVWWGFGLFGLAVGAWWTLIGPMLMTVLLLKVSGVKLLEKTIGHRRPEYADYVRRTSAFIPWPPRRS